MITSGDGEVVIGKRCKISSDVQIVFHKPAKVVFGDYCVIGTGVKFVCDGGDITIDDWTTIHDRSLVLSTKGVNIGQHCWFGQQCILDGTGGLTIGNGVRVGMYSQIWSHVAAGEQIEGCTLYGTRSVTLEDNVWLVGSCIVASGVTIGSKSIALIMSNITKSWPTNTVLAGSPAQPKQNLTFYKDISFKEKWALLDGWLKEVSEEYNIVRVVEDACITLTKNDEMIIFNKDTSTQENLVSLFPHATICTLSTKQYVKKLTSIEEIVLKWLAGNKARFLKTG